MMDNNYVINNGPYIKKRIVTNRRYDGNKHLNQKLRVPLKRNSDARGGGSGSVTNRLGSSSAMRS